ncbi:right-handed parallel beta-helix repeat-containing protein [Oscillatoria sp. CS-180]|uniref:right-handed parallel beta-helix repeat-containing protein n=1 Tax=Oscillatoria sp. CS-180 TaxID=3021720 RepID=UPI00232F1AA1|nr:right-handed parallel beta-helix repeat-containing protein [Oscillatoria sp. CS-180]MDB9527638.1 right-handed parallel beta-helix repeat-containing protein [Oscillatoria sp. CS-180]
MTRSRRWFIQAGLVTTAGTALALKIQQQVRAEALIQVNTTAEFVGAIGPNRTLEVAPGSLVLSELSLGRQNSYAVVQEAYDGYELVISGVDNLTIVGKDNTLSRVLTRPRYADVLKFKNCRNLTLENLELAHTKDLGYCQGAVLSFSDCTDVAVNRCVLYGSGTYGIEAARLINLTCRETIIRDCTYGMVCINQGQNLAFENCQLFDNAGLSMINLNECSQVAFSNCLVHDNSSDFLDYAIPHYLFYVWESAGIQMQDCQVYDNSIAYLASAEGAIAVTDTVLANNTFGGALYPAEPEHLSPFCPVS